MFYAGQKVVRIKRRPSRGTAPKGTKFSTPKVGDICTVKSVTSWPGITLLTFFEHDNSHLKGSAWSRTMEPGFPSEYFRPLCEPNTEAGLAVLRKALTGDLVEEGA